MQPIDAFWVPVTRVPYPELKRQAVELEVCRKRFWLDTEPTERDVLEEIQRRKDKVDVIHCNPNPPKTLKFAKENLRVINWTYEEWIIYV